MAIVNITRSGTTRCIRVNDKEQGQYINGSTTYVRYVDGALFLREECTVSHNSGLKMSQMMTEQMYHHMQEINRLKIMRDEKVRQLALGPNQTCKLESEDTLVSKHIKELKRLAATCADPSDVTITTSGDERLYPLTERVQYTLGQSQIYWVKQNLDSAIDLSLQDNQVVTKTRVVEDMTMTLPYSVENELNEIFDTYLLEPVFFSLSYLEN
jgi:hypothetical protein